jgi:hypothetical protein
MEVMFKKKNRLPLWDRGEDHLRLYVLVRGKQPAIALVEILDNDGDTWSWKKHDHGQARQGRQALVSSVSQARRVEQGIS